MRGSRRFALALAGLLSGCAGSSPSAPRGDPAAPDVRVEPASFCGFAPIAEPDATQPFRSLTATLVDRDGAAIEGAIVSVCGFDACIGGDVAPGGVASVQVRGAPLDMRGPAFHVGNGLDLAELAYRLPPSAELALGPTVAVRLPPPAAAPALVAGRASTFADVTITLAEGAVLAFDALVYDESRRGLRAAPIELSRPPIAVDPALGLELAWVLAPQATTVCPPAAIAVPNTLDWPAGTAVEFLVHGLELRQRFAPYGGWAVVSAGAVSADGERIESAAGEGIPVLSAVGVRRRAASRAQPG